MQKTLGKDHADRQASKQKTIHSAVKAASSNSKNTAPKAESLRAERSTPSFTTARKRAAIKITLRRRLLKKAKYCCEFLDTKTNTKCQSHYQLQIDHLIPLARGGSDGESNLRALSRTHNLLAAKRWGGALNKYP